MADAKKWPNVSPELQSIIDLAVKADFESREFKMNIVKSLQDENERLRAALERIAETAPFGSARDIARAALKENNNG